MQMECPFINTISTVHEILWYPFIVFLLNIVAYKFSVLDVYFEIETFTFYSDKLSTQW